MKLSEVSSKIKPRTAVRVKGKVNYSHIASKIAGAELERANQYTNYPSKDPYYKIEIEILEPVEKDNIIFNDPSDESEQYLAVYLASRFYTPKKEENQGKKFFSATSKGETIRVFQIGADGKAHPVKLNGNELGKGCNVQLELNFFESKYGVGVGLNAVIIDGEIQVYEGANQLKGFEVANDTISLEPRAAVVNDDIAQAANSNETPVAEVQSEVETSGVEVDPEPVGTTSAPSNAGFDAILAQFKNGN